MLTGQGFDRVYNPKGGIRAWNGERVKGPAEVGLGFLTGGESPAEVIGLAYCLEEGLRLFYREMADRPESASLAATYSRLAALEDGHQARLYRRLKEMGQELPPPRTLADQCRIPAVEGGLTAAELIDLYRPDLETPADVIQAAMMFEAQALDLYWRYADREETGPTKDLFWELCAQEKNHLKTLGRLLEKTIPHPGETG